MSDGHTFDMDREETEQGLEDAYRDGLIDSVGTTPGGSPKFTLNEDGMDYVDDLFQDSDAALAQLATLVVRDAPDGKKTERLVLFAGKIRDDHGVNMIRRLAETDEVAVPAAWDDFSEEFLAKFDPEDE